MVIQGVIRPPPEIRAVADRTALYVSKNGRAFETRIVNSAKGKTPKFAFLQPTNPFHAYYEQRIQFYEAGGKDGDDDADKKKYQEGKEAAEAKAVEEKKANDAEAQKAKEQQAQLIQSVPDPVAKALLTQRNKIAQIRSKFDPKDSSEQLDSDEATNQVPTNAAIIPPPPPFHFINIVSPSSLTVAQIETIQVVAQMTALDGKGGGFLQALTLREWGNPQFAFCQPRHGHFAYFPRWSMPIAASCNCGPTTTMRIPSTKMIWFLKSVTIFLNAWNLLPIVANMNVIKLPFDKRKVLAALCRRLPKLIGMILSWSKPSTSPLPNK